MINPFFSCAAWLTAILVTVPSASLAAKNVVFRLANSGAGFIAFDGNTVIKPVTLPLDIWYYARSLPVSTGTVSAVMTFELRYE